MEEFLFKLSVFRKKHENIFRLLIAVFIIMLIGIIGIVSYFINTTILNPDTNALIRSPQPVVTETPTPTGVITSEAPITTTRVPQTIQPTPTIIITTTATPNPTQTPKPSAKPTITQKPNITLTLTPSPTTLETPIPTQTETTITSTIEATTIVQGLESNSRRVQTSKAEDTFSSYLILGLASMIIAILIAWGFSEYIIRK